MKQFSRLALHAAGAKDVPPKALLDVADARAASIDTRLLSPVTVRTQKVKDMHGLIYFRHI